MGKEGCVCIKEGIVLLGLIVVLSFVVLCFAMPFYAEASTEVNGEASCYIQTNESPFWVETPNHEQVEITSGDSYEFKGAITYSKAYRSTVEYLWLRSQDGQVWETLEGDGDNYVVANLSPGIYQYRLVAKDGLGNSATETFNIKVSPSDASGDSDGRADVSEVVSQAEGNRSSLSEGATQGANTVSSAGKTADNMSFGWLVVLCFVVLGSTVLVVKASINHKKRG